MIRTMDSPFVTDSGRALQSLKWARRSKRKWAALIQVPSWSKLIPNLQSICSSSDTAQNYKFPCPWGRLRYRHGLSLFPLWSFLLWSWGCVVLLIWVKIGCMRSALLKMNPPACRRVLWILTVRSCTIYLFCRCLCLDFPLGADFCLV